MGLLTVVNCCLYDLDSVQRLIMYEAGTIERQARDERRVALSVAEQRALIEEIYQLRRDAWWEAENARLKAEREDKAYWAIARYEASQKPEEPLISDKEGGLLVLGAAVCCALAAPLTAAGVAFGALILAGHSSD